MRKIEVREPESSAGATITTIVVGVAAGFAVGMYVAQRMGGFGGLAARLRPRRRSGATRTDEYYEAAGEDFLGETDLGDDDADLADSHADGADDADEFADDDEFADEEEVAEAEAGAAPDGAGPVLEERVLEAFNNDPILSERAIDIGAIGPGDIELEGWVDDDEEAEHAVTLARGVPGVRSVANRLMVDEEIGDRR